MNSGEAAAGVVELPQLPAVSLPAQVEDLHQLDPLAQSVSPSTTVNTVNTTTDQDSTAEGMSIMRSKTSVLEGLMILSNRAVSSLVGLILMKKLSNHNVFSVYMFSIITML